MLCIYNLWGWGYNCRDSERLKYGRNIKEISKKYERDKHLPCIESNTSKDAILRQLTFGQ